MRTVQLISMALIVLLCTSMAEARRTNVQRTASHLYRWSKFQVKRFKHNLGKDADERLTSAQFGRYQKLDPGKQRSYLASQQRAVMAKKLKRGRAAVADLLKHAKLSKQFATEGNQRMFQAASGEVTQKRHEAAYHLSDVAYYAKKRGLDRPSSVRIMANRVLRGMKLAGEADLTATKNHLYVAPPSRETSALIRQMQDGYAIHTMAK